MDIQPGTLLAVDDDPLALCLLEALLEPQGYRLRCCSEPSQVLDLLREEPAELLLLDIEMPGLSGIELCRQIQADPELKGTPVIFITARTEEAYLLAAFEAGGLDYLTKPFRQAELLARIRTHLSLRRSERQLQHQLAFREMMLTVLSHDLRGPLSSAGDYLQSLIRGSFNPIEMLARLSVLDEAIGSTRRLLDQTLNWARSLHEETPFRPAWCELAPLAQDSIAPYKLKAAEKGLSLEIDVPAGTYALIDPDMIRTLLLNLVNNAVKFTPGPGRISLKAEFGIGELKLSVSDTGIGLSPDQLATLSEAEGIESLDGTGGEKGSGLGVRICHQLARRHGGQLEISSSPGQGSRFSLVLPTAARFGF